MATIKEVITHATAAGLGVSIGVEVFSAHSLVYSLVAGASLGAACVGIGYVIVSKSYKTWFSKKAVATTTAAASTAATTTATDTTTTQS